MKPSLLIQVTGIVCFVGGVAWFSIPLGLALFGAAVFVAGVIIEKEGK
jgi:hypothetical protein